MRERPVKSILVIDESDYLVDMLAIICRDSDYTVHLLQHLHDPLADVVEQQPGIILMNRDSMFWDASTLSRTIRDSYTNENLVLLLYGEQATAAEGYREAGANAVFDKPTGVTQMFEAIELYLHR